MRSAAKMIDLVTLNFDLLTTKWASLLQVTRETFVSIDGFLRIFVLDLGI